MKIFIIRGLPGSGKTTLAKQIAGQNQAAHFEADHFFETPDGGYKFDAQKLKEAHAECLSNTIRTLANGGNVVVSNTFTTMAELNSYLSAARLFKAELKVVKCTANYGSIHEVPDHVVNAMRQRWEPCPGEIEV